MYILCVWVVQQVICLHMVSAKKISFDGDLIMNHVEW